MGIQGLLAFAKKEFAGYQVDKYSRILKQLGSGTKVLAVDAGTIMHADVCTSMSNGLTQVQQLETVTGEAVEKKLASGMISSMFYRILKLSKHGVIPLMVFDGKASSLKGKTCGARNDKAKQANQALSNLTPDDPRYLSELQKSVRVTMEDVFEVKLLLRMMGLSWIDAPGEADTVCAWLCDQRDEAGNPYVHGVYANDGDILALGASRMVRTAKGKVDMLEMFTLEEMLETWELSFSQFQDFCVLIGNDYSERVKGYGPVKALRAIQNYGDLRTTLDNIPVTEEQKQSILIARKYFKIAKSRLDNCPYFRVKGSDMKMISMQREELMDYLVVKHGMNAERIGKKLMDYQAIQEKMGVTDPNTHRIHRIIRKDMKDAIIQNAIDAEKDQVETEEAYRNCVDSFLARA